MVTLVLAGNETGLYSNRECNESLCTSAMVSGLNEIATIRGVFLGFQILLEGAGARGTRKSTSMDRSYYRT